MGSSFTLRGLFAAVLLGTGLVAGVAAASDKGNPEAKRIVSIGGTITEILYALGAEDRIVARDSTSFYPDAANSKPDVGYMRALSAEGILGQKPDLILMEEGSGPPPVIEILKASEVPMVVIATPPKVDAIGRKIRDVAFRQGRRPCPKDGRRTEDTRCRRCQDSRPEKEGSVRAVARQ
jgi:iron complex transport system substrate-binding protein